MLNVPCYRRSFLFSLLVFVGAFNALCWNMAIFQNSWLSNVRISKFSDCQILCHTNLPLFQFLNLPISRIPESSIRPALKFSDLLIKERMIFIAAVRTQYRWLHAIEASAKNLFSGTLFSTEIDIYYTFSDTALISVNFKKAKRGRIPNKPIRRNNIEDLALCRLVFGTGVSGETYYNEDDSTSNKIYNQWNQQWRESFQKDYRSNWLLFL